jgi:hypothetical protein
MKDLFYYFVWISFLTCLFLAWYFSHKARHEERKMLIQKGLNADDLVKTEKGFKFPWFKLGIVIIGLSVGLGIIAILVNLGLTGRSDAIYPAILGLCGGSSLVIAYFIDKRSKQR